MPLGQPGANYPVRVMRQTLHILYNKYIIYLHALFVRCTYLYMLNVYIYAYSACVYQFSLSGHSKGLAFAASAHSRSRRKLPINLENLEATGRSHAQWRNHLLYICVYFLGDKPFETIKR